MAHGSHGRGHDGNPLKQRWDHQSRCFFFVWRLGVTGGKFFKSRSKLYDDVVCFGERRRCVMKVPQNLENQAFLLDYGECFDVKEETHVRNKNEPWLPFIQQVLLQLSPPRKGCVKLSIAQHF